MAAMMNDPAAMQDKGSDGLQFSGSVLFCPFALHLPDSGGLGLAGSGVKKLCNFRPYDLQPSGGRQRCR